VDDLQSEKEQLEEMRQWWSDNGRYVIGGIVIGAGLLFGWNNYQSSKLVAQSEASALFESLAGHVDDGDVDDAALVADQMALDFADTSYTAQSKLGMARLYMDQNRDQDAAEVLQQLLAMSGHDELQNVGRLRLAKIMLYQDRPQEVIELLDGEGGTAFAAQYADATGDAYVAMGDFAAAEQAYQSVLADAAQGSVDRNIVQMKLIDLPDTTAAQFDAPAPEAPVDDALDAAAADPEADTESDNSVEAEDAE
jgi:predicted negative regulator of RcsB-dependent stress response